MGEGGRGQTSDSNCAPLSEVIVLGTPKRETHRDRRAEAQNSAVASALEWPPASGHTDQCR